MPSEVFLVVLSVASVVSASRIEGSLPTDHEVTKLNSETDSSNSGWAKPLAPDVGFVPQKVYTQVRRYETVKHLPRSAAAAEAVTYEEVVNAPRLREVLTHKKTQQVYEEEGYEDSAYDHGGYNHHGEQVQDKEASVSAELKALEDADETGSRSERSHSKPINEKVDEAKLETFLDEGSPEKIENDDTKSTENVGTFELKVSSSESEGRRDPTVRRPKLGVTHEEMQHQEGNRRTVDESVDGSARQGARSIEGRVINNSRRPPERAGGTVTFPGRHTRRQYGLGHHHDVFVQESVGYGVRRPIYGLPVTPNFHHYLPYTPAFPSYYSDNSGAYSSMPIVAERQPQRRITTTQAPPLHLNTPSNTGPVQFLNGADTLNAYATILQQASEKDSITASPNIEDLIQPRFNSTEDIDAPQNTSTARRKPSKFRHSSVNLRGKQYNNFTRSTTNQPNNGGPRGKSNSEFKNPSPHTRHPSLPRDSSEKDDSALSAVKSALAINHVLPHSRSRPTDPVKYIEQLTVAHFSGVANVASSPPSVQNERLRELARQLNANSEHLAGRPLSRIKRNTVEYDKAKYPFYDSLKLVHPDSALKYASDPDDVPRKTHGGMEFYESRHKLVQCDEPQPPEVATPEQKRSPKPRNLPRIKHVGDAIDCFKERYFGKDPLDSPFFKEDEPVLRSERAVTGVNRVMTVHSNQENNSQHANDNHTATQSLGEERASGGYRTFPYKNHKPETAEVSPPVQNLRATSPYKYYSEHNDSYLPNYVPDSLAQGNELDEGARIKYRRPPHNQQFSTTKTRKRVRPTEPLQPHGGPPMPVSIYSIIAGSERVPVYRRPIAFSSSSQQNRVIPIYQIDTTRAPDKYQSEYGPGYKKAPPTRWYIVRPGEYTENKDIAADSKPASSSFWNYINPLRWWFPSYFDERRGEPKHRRRRSLEEELFNRILARTNNATAFESHKTSPVTTGLPISINEFKARIGANGNKNKTERILRKLSRLTGGFMKNDITTTTAVPVSTTRSEAQSYGEMPFKTVVQSTSPMSEGLPSTTSKPKVLFPRTKIPSSRTYQSSRKDSSSRNAFQTTTTTTTTTTTPSTTTRMYKPKRVLNKKFDGPGLPVDAFPLLNNFKSAKHSYTTDSSEEPRRYQNVEHRRVTKEEEEIVTTRYVHPQQYSSTEDRPSDESTESFQVATNKPDDHTLTYLMNPVTGVGSWGEHPRRPSWKPKRRYQKRIFSDGSTRKAMYSRPPPSQARNTRRRHLADAPQYESQDYVAGLMSRLVPPPARRSKSVSLKQPHEYTESTATEDYSPAPTKRSPKFILDPGKRKYFYVKI